MKRGEIVLVTAPGDFGKARPALVVQADLFNETHASVVVCLLTTDLQEAPLFRVDVVASEQTGLNERSQVMVDKIVALRKKRIGRTVGTVDDATLLRVSRSLALFLGIAS